jgi:16S rRNA (uracil1498-N3)-methyltransferase
MASVAQFFFEADLVQGETVQLDEQTARHIVQVLRKQPGDKIRLSNGKGYIADATIAETNKKRCTVSIDGVLFFDERRPFLHLAVAFTKNASRNEWMLEKATELGVKSIIPLSATRIEKEHIRYDRARGILVSAMLQSQGAYLPELSSKPVALKEVLNMHTAVPQKLLAHCIDGLKKETLHKAMQPGAETIILIGPEGDFTAEEVALCEENGFAGISMGTQRLRTETAAIAVCAYFNMMNNDR